MTHGGNSSIDIREVASKSDLTQFIRLPYAFYENDPNYVKPLEFERHQALSKAKNPYFQHADVAYFMAFRNGEPVGRISAQSCQRVHDLIDPELGQFGMFECVNDPDVALALMNHAEAWLRERGMTKIQGPFNLSVNQECGLLVDGFDKPPMMLMPFNLPYYEDLLAGLGFQKKKDMYAYKMKIDKDIPKKMQRLVKMARNNKKLTMRSINTKDFKNEMAVVFDIFNDAWSDNWGFVPFTKEEAAFSGDEMKPILRNWNAKIVEYEGRPAAFMLAAPNINLMMRDLDGKLLPFGWAKFLWRLFTQPWPEIRVPLMGVRKEFQSTLIGGSMAIYLIEEIRLEAVKHGATVGELSWILEDNMAMRNILEEADSNIDKTYRIFEKTL